MPKNPYGLAILTLFLASIPADAGKLDVLQGKFTFNWLVDPGRQKCVKVGGRLLAEFKSAKYRCDLNAKTNTSAGASVRTCTQVKGRGREYLIFDTFRACEEERKTQESNE